MSEIQEEITHLANLTRLLQRNLILIRNVVEFFLRHIDSCARDKVDLAIYEPIEMLITRSIERRSFDLSSFVHERAAEEFTLSAGVRPRLDVGLLEDTGFDRPFILIRTEPFDRIDRRWLLAAKRAAAVGVVIVAWDRRSMWSLLWLLTLWWGCLGRNRVRDRFSSSFERGRGSYPFLVEKDGRFVDIENDHKSICRLESAL